jgi:hypothetical protein
VTQQEIVAEAIKKVHSDPTSLRELLIATTSRDTVGTAMEYFRRHLDDEKLLAALVEIALEGEDMGDAPWAAANTIVEFPAPMFKGHEASLRKLGEEQRIYLSRPANKALAKITSL